MLVAATCGASAEGAAFTHEGRADETMSGDRRCACREQGAGARSQFEFSTRLRTQGAEQYRRRQVRRRGRNHGAGKMNECADCAVVVGEGRGSVAVPVAGGNRAGGLSAREGRHLPWYRAVEM